MKTPEYPIEPVAPTDAQLFEQVPNVPIVNFVRHGGHPSQETWNGGLTREPMDTSAPDFKLDSEHLDLTNTGIEEIRSAMRQLAERINKEREIVLGISSPAWRSHSSALVGLDELRRLGVPILETPDLKFSDALRPANYIGKELFDIQAKDPSDRSDKEKKLLEKSKRVSPISSGRTVAHEEVLNTNFQRFLRHINNIYSFLSEETKQKIQGKRLRVICFAHEETTRNLLHEAFPEEKRILQYRGQILEIVPQSTLGKDGETATKVTLIPTPEGENGKEAVIKRGFTPKLDNSEKEL